MKNYFILLVMMLFSATGFAVTITESAGWFETVWVKWLPVDGAQSYNVYFSGAGVTDKKIDDNLIRSYGDYLRADIPGLKPGSYTVRVAAVINNQEVEAATTTSITAMAHDRSGFAFSNNRVPGAYKADGSPKDNAVIIYLTNNNKNTISMEVTGANSNPCVGIQAILDGFKKGKDTRPLIVRVVGQITDPAELYNGDMVIENKNNANSFITIEGIGDDAVIDGWGIRIKNACNIEIRNLGIMNVDSGEGDNIGLQQDNEYIWVHHIDMFYGHAGSDADQIKGDGALDCKGSTYVTFSYNHFWDAGKACLLGLNERTTSGLYITYHHNWFDHSDSRHPRVRYFSAHVYNNYYDGNSKYGVGSTLGSSVFVERNYFRNCKYPMMISMQGTDVFDASKNTNDYNNMPTFSNEDGGIIKAFDNYIEGAKRFVNYGNTAFPNPTVDFDAYVVSTRNETVPETVISYEGNNKYNNFDTDNSIMYAYVAESPQQAKTTVEHYAGRIDGGDLKWTFDNGVDDASYAVNTGLKQAVTNYKTKLVSIQNDSNNGGTTDPDPEEPDVPVNPGDMEHNFTVSGTSSTFYTITGNLSTSKGTVTYNGLTLTKCLKMESSTQITFTLEQSGTLILVFNDNFNGKVKIDRVSNTATNGIVVDTLSAGDHTITKDDSTNLFYMNISVSTSTEKITATNYTIVQQGSQLQVSGGETINRIEIYTISGILVKRVESNCNNINIADMTNGVYIIKIYDGKQGYTSKFMKR